MKKTKINKILLLFIAFVALTLSITACDNKDNKEIGSKTKTEEENKEKPKEISKEDLKFIEEAVKNTASTSFRYDKNFGTYIGVQASEEEVDKNISDEELKEHVTGFMYYTKTEQPNGKLLLQKYLVPKHIKELGQLLENTSLKTKGLVNKTKDGEYKIYNENVVFVDKDTDPVMREYYYNGKLIKEGGKSDKLGKGVRLNRLPDEDVFTYALIKTMPMDKIFEAGKKTKYLKMPVTADKEAYYVAVRESSATMFVNEVFKMMLEEPELMQNYIDGLKSFGVDVNDPDCDGYKALSRQYYVDSKVTTENLLREGVRYLRLCGFLRDTSNIPELIKEKNFDTKLVLGKFLKKLYEEGNVPINNTNKAIYFNIDRDKEKKPYITMITQEKIYNNYVGDIEQVFLTYDRDEQSQVLEKNMETLSNITEFKGEMNPLYTAKMRMLTSTKYLDKIVEAIPYETFYQDWYNYVRNINMENKIDNSKLNLSMLNGLEKTRKDRGQFTDKSSNWIMDIIFMNNLGECVNCSDLGDNLIKVTGENNFGNKEKKSIEQEFTLYFYNPLKSGRNYSGKDEKTDLKVDFERTDGNKKPIYFKLSKKNEIPEHVNVFLEKLNDTFGKTDEEIKKEQNKKDNQPVAVEGQPMAKDYDKLRKEIPYKDGNLIDYDKMLEVGAWNTLREGDGYYQVNKLAYNKKLSDVEMINNKGDIVKVSDVIKPNKKTILLYGDINCPFCINFFKTLSKNENLWSNKYNLVIFSKIDKDELETSGKENLNEILSKELDKKEIGKVFKFIENNMYFGAEEFARTFQIDYKPTVIYLNEDGYVYYTSSGATDKKDLESLLKEVENLEKLKDVAERDEDIKSK